MYMLVLLDIIFAYDKNLTVNVSRKEKGQTEDVTVNESVDGNEQDLGFYSP